MTLYDHASNQIFLNKIPDSSTASDDVIIASLQWPIDPHSP